MNSRIGDILSNLCSGARHLIIAAPYIKTDALTRILADVSEAASLICVTRWNPHDIAVGASDTECRAIVTKRGGSFQLHPSLHAKYYRIDDAVLIGSANLTRSAMGWSPQSNLEILCHPSDDFDTYAFQECLLENAREITDDEFACWESITQISVPSNRTATEGQPLLDTWCPATRDPRHLELAYQGQTDNIASFDERQAALHDIQFLLIPPDLSNEQFRMWTSTCLFAAPFTNAVIQLHDMEAISASRILSKTYSLGITEARRSMETVQNWIAFFTHGRGLKHIR